MSATSVTAARPVAPAWLAVLAAPLSFGITGPTLVLGELERDLGVSPASAASVVTAFGWGIAVGTPLTGVLLARRGHRSTVLLAIGLAVLGSALAVAAAVLAAGTGLTGGAGLTAMVVGAGVQGIGSAGFTVVALQLARSAAAMGAVTASMASLGAVAPLIGSQVSAALGWPAVLALPLVSLIAAPAALRAGAPAAEKNRAAGADPVGAVLLVAWVTALVFLPTRPLPAGLAVLVLTSALALHLRRRPDGFVPAAVPRSPRFVGSAALGFGLAVVNFGIVYTAPGLLAAQTGWTSAQLGVAFLVPYLAGGALSWFLVAGSARQPGRAVVAVLAGTSLLAVASVTFGAGVSGLVFAGMLLGSLAAATGQGALALRAGAAVPPSVRPAAMGLFTLCFLLGAAFGPAVAALTSSA